MRIIGVAGFLTLLAVTVILVVLVTWPQGNQLGTPVAVGRHPWAVALDEGTQHAFIVNNLSNTVSVLDLTTATLMRTVPVGLSPNAVTVDTRRRRAIVTNQMLTPSSTAGSISILDTESGRLLRTIKIAGSPIAVACDEAVGRSFVVLASGAIVVIETSSGVRLATVQVGHAPATMVLDSRQHRLFLTDRKGVVRVLSTRTTRMLMSIRAGQSPFALATDERTGHIFIGDRGTAPTRVFMVDGHTGRLLRTVGLAPGLDPLQIVVDVRTRRVFVMNGGSINRPTGTIVTIDADTGRFVNSTPVGGNPSDIVVESDTQRVYVANADSNSVSVLDAHNGQQAHVAPVMNDPVLLAVDRPTHRAIVVGFDYNNGPPPARNATLFDHLMERLRAIGSVNRVGGTARILDTHTLR